MIGTANILFTIQLAKTIGEKIFSLVWSIINEMGKCLDQVLNEWSQQGSISSIQS